MIDDKQKSKPIIRIICIIFILNTTLKIKNLKNILLK